jgi:hypothetical protein
MTLGGTVALGVKNCGPKSLKAEAGNEALGEGAIPDPP